jgi:hypothetical protein
MMLERQTEDVSKHLLCLIPFFEPAHHGRDVVGGCTEVVCSSGISTYVKPVPTSWFAGSSMTLVQYLVRVCMEFASQKGLCVGAVCGVNVGLSQLFARVSWSDTEYL